MKLTGAEIIMEVLIEQGVTDIFGYPGGTVLNIYEALYNRRDKVHHYITAHEQGATHAADGYARATGKTGVVLCTSGPGVTNTVTGIATAYLDSIPMVIITANVGVDYIGKDSFQEVFIAGITQPITKHNYAVRDITRLADTVRTAFKIAGSGRKGPVLIDVPKDITAASCEFEPQKKWVEPKQPCAPVQQLESVAALCGKARRPVICFGGGIVSADAEAEVYAFIHKTKIPACHTIMATGILPYGDELDLGMLGMHGSIAANRAVDEADLLLTMGMRFSDRVALDTNDFAPHAKIVQFDIDASEIRKNVEVDIAVVGDIKTELAVLLPMVESIERRKWAEKIGTWRSADVHVNDKVSSSICPQEIMDVIGEKCGGNVIIATDVGQHQIWAAQFCRKVRKRGFITSGGLGTMGFGYGAAIGAQVGVPDATVIHITGDGSFHMNLNECCTAVTNKLHIITVIFDNRVLGMVRQWQKLFYHEHYCETVLDRQTDYIKVVEGFGGTGFRAGTRDEFADVLEKALHCEGPVWIVCPIDRDERVLPMIPGGGTVRSMITD